MEGKRKLGENQGKAVGIQLQTDDCTVSAAFVKGERLSQPQRSLKGSIMWTQNSSLLSGFKSQDNGLHIFPPRTGSLESE